MTSAQPAPEAQAVGSNHHNLGQRAQTAVDVHRVPGEFTKARDGQLGDIVDIGPRTEGFLPGAGEDENRHTAILRQSVGDVKQFFEHAPTQRVQLVGSIQRHPNDAILVRPPDQDLLVVHDEFPLSISGHNLSPPARSGPSAACLYANGTTLHTCPPFNRKALSRMIRLAFDIGGTFTDIVLHDSLSGALHVAKTLTTPDDLARAVMTGLDAVLDETGWKSSDIGRPPSRHDRGDERHP